MKALPLFTIFFLLILFMFLVVKYLSHKRAEKKLLTATVSDYKSLLDLSVKVPWTFTFLGDVSSSAPFWQNVLTYFYPPQPAGLYFDQAKIASEKELYFNPEKVESITIDSLTIYNGNDNVINLFYQLPLAQPVPLLTNIPTGISTSLPKLTIPVTSDQTVKFPLDLAGGYGNNTYLTLNVTPQYRTN